MTPTETAAILRQFNKWQRGCNAVLRPSSIKTSEAIDAAIEMIERLEAAEKERDTLRAKIEVMEKQFPICRVKDLKRAHYMTKVVGLDPDAWLYPAPGAQPAPSVPEDVMRDAERYRYLRARDDGTAGVGCWLEAKGRVCDRGWLYGDQLDSAIDTCIEMIAAAPEAKPCP